MLLQAYNFYRLPTDAYAKKLFLQKYKFCFCVLIGFGIIPYYLNSFTALPFKNNDGLVTTINGLRWIEKRNFYAKVNAEIGEDQKNILLYYIQDKFSNYYPNKR